MAKVILFCFICKNPASLFRKKMLRIQNLLKRKKLQGNKAFSHFFSPQCLEGRIIFVTLLSDSKINYKKILNWLQAKVRLVARSYTFACKQFKIPLQAMNELIMIKLNIE